MLNELYSQASQWFAEAGLVYEAIQYGLIARDYEQIITLINSVSLVLLNRSHYTILGSWLDQIPRSKIYEYPELALFLAWVCLYNDNYCADEKALLAAEEGFRASGNDQKLGEVFVIRAFSANYQGDLAATIKYSNQALKLLSEKNVLMLGGVTLALGRAYLNNGEVAKSFEVINQSRQYNQQAEYLAGQSMCDRELGNIAVLQGKLSEGINYYLKIIETLKERPEEPISVYIDLAKVYLEWNRLDSASQYAQLAEEYSLKTQALDFLPACYLLQAKISRANQQLAESLNFLQKAITAFAERPNKKLQVQLEVLQIQLWLELGQDKFLEEWYQTAIIQYDDLTKALPFFQEPKVLAFVRVLIARQQFSLAWTHLKALEQLAKEQGRVGSLIQIYILMALVAQYTTPTIVTDSLDQALRLAQPGGYIRTFVDEGNAVEVLLRVRAVTSNSITSYINTILAAYNVSNNSASAITPTNETPFVNQTKPGQEFESLTERELEVLSLVASGASNREIGEKMVITLPTVKKHLSNIFSKLNVTSRTQLLVRAKELSLL